MVVLLEITNFAAIETLIVSIPESVGVLIFGVVLVLTALLIRRVLGRSESEKADEKTAK
ncbi:MAG: hypothetical protein ABL959_00615 [Pyrinomonadaceae bacterium]